MAAGDHPPQPDEQQPDGDQVGQDAHSAAPRSVWSRNSVRIRATAHVTSAPTATLSTAIVPDDSSSPLVPRGRKFANAADANTSPPMATSAYAIAPEASATSTSDVGSTRLSATTCPAAYAS